MTFLRLSAPMPLFGFFGPKSLPVLGTLTRGKVLAISAVSLVLTYAFWSSPSSVGAVVDTSRSEED